MLKHDGNFSTLIGQLGADAAKTDLQIANGFLPPDSGPGKCRLGGGYDDLTLAEIGSKFVFTVFGHLWRRRSAVGPTYPPASTVSVCRDTSTRWVQDSHAYSQLIKRVRLQFSRCDERYTEEINIQSLARIKGMGTSA